MNKTEQQESEVDYPVGIQLIVGRNLRYVKAPNGTLVIKDMKKFVSQLESFYKEKYLGDWRRG